MAESGKIGIVLDEANRLLPLRRYELIEVKREGAKMQGFDFLEADSARKPVLARQTADSGFITDYAAVGKNPGFGKVETTSLCVLALD